MRHRLTLPVGMAIHIARHMRTCRRQSARPGPGGMGHYGAIIRMQIHCAVNMYVKTYLYSQKIQQHKHTLKQQTIEYVRLQLGEQIIDVELDAEHYESAYRAAVNTYRQRAQNAYEESYSFMELVANVNIYDLPEEVIQVDFWL